MGWILALFYFLLKNALDLGWHAGPSIRLNPQAGNTSFKNVSPNNASPNMEEKTLTHHDHMSRTVWFYKHKVFQQKTVVDPEIQ